MRTSLCLTGVATPSCAGKGEVAQHVAAARPAPVVGLDACHRDLAQVPLEQRARASFDRRESVLPQYEATVRPMAERCILPAWSSASLVLNGAGPIQEPVALVLARVPGVPAR